MGQIQIGEGTRADRLLQCEEKVDQVQEVYLNTEDGRDPGRDLLEVQKAQDKKTGSCQTNNEPNQLQDPILFQTGAKAAHIVHPPCSELHLAVGLLHEKRGVRVCDPAVFVARVPPRLVRVEGRPYCDYLEARSEDFVEMPMHEKRAPRSAQKPRLPRVPRLQSHPEERKTRKVDGLV